MNTTKVTTLSIAVLIMLSMLFFLTRFFLRKALRKNESGVISLSAGIWFSTFFLSGVILINETIAVYTEAIDIISKITPSGYLPDYFKTGSLLVGLTILWLVLWYFLSNTFMAILVGRRDVVYEAENNNYTYFLIRGAIYMGFIICFLPALELILRAFIPHIEIPFYH